MSEYRFSSRADEELRDIWRNIAADNERAADAFLGRLLDKLELAATQPRMGSPRPQLGPTARILVEGQYVVIYQPTTDGILVVAIVHGARDPDHWLN